jgi:hypothetical protein
MAILKRGLQVLGGGSFAYVAKDREGYYFTLSQDGSGKRIRLVYIDNVWKYVLPGTTIRMVAVFTDPPKKLRS